MEKKTNQYRITLEQISSAKASTSAPEPIALTFGNHDDVFAIIDQLQRKNPFNNPEETAQFAIGLKLFSEIMIKHRTNPLFGELMPAFRPFMQKLKAD